MSKFKQTIFTSVLLCALLATAVGQESTGSSVQRSSLAITAATAGERVRITAPSSVVQMRVEVYAPNGEKLFDQEIRGGNVFDWHLQDGQAQRLAPGAYICVVTAKSISGKLTQKIGTVKVEESSASVQPAESLSAPQAQTIGPVEENSSWTILGQKENQTTTVIAHDGADGQLIRGRGALTFRVGDFFSGNDQEQMRLTEAGDLGIGTATPKAKLDVAGMISAREGFMFADGSTLNMNDKGTLTVTGANGNVVPNVAGTGTQNRLAKWTDGAGTLGDSLLNESGGGIEVRPAAAGGSGVNPIILNPNNVPSFAQFQFYPATGPNANMSFTVVPRGAGTPNNKAQFSIFGTDLFADAINYEFASLRARGSDFVFGTGKSGTGQVRPLMLAAGFLSDNTTNNGQLFLDSNGRIGVGTISPGNKLDVNGDINTSTGYNIGGNRILSMSPSNTACGNLFLGLVTGVHNQNGCENSFFGSSAGLSNDAGNYNSFFGASAGLINTTGERNSFFGFAAGANNLTGADNAFFGNIAGGGIVNANSPGSKNSFFGSSSGLSNTNGNDNSFFGYSSGSKNTSGTGNAFFGSSSGLVNTNGGANTFFGDLAGSKNDSGNFNNFSGFQAGVNSTSGSNNTFIGASSGSSNTVEGNNTFIGFQSDGAANITNATAIGANAKVTQSNSLVLGDGVNVGIGTTNPTTATGGRVLHIEGGSSVLKLVATNTGGQQWEWQSTIFNSVGIMNLSNLTTSHNPLTILANDKVGISTLSPDQTLSVNGDASKLGGGSWLIFSDERLKNIKGRFTPGIKAVMQLQPIRYEYKPDNALGIKSSGVHIGFGAQAVQKIIPEAVTKNDKGYLLVNNDPIMWTMLNAIKEQQKEVEEQQRTAQQQQDQIAELRTANTVLNARLRLIERTLKTKRGPIRRRR